MMLDYQIGPNTRRCSVTGRELKPGEPVFSVLLDRGGKFLRQDFSKEAWQGPPAGAYSFWVGRVPAGEGRRKPAVDDELLLDLFERLRDEPDAGKRAVRYVLALLLMRRRKLRFERAGADDGGERLEVRDPRSGALHTVANPGLSDDRILAVQEDVFRALGWE